MIYIDASRYNNTKKRTGVENYSFYLINELVRQSPNDITLISPKKIPLDVKQITIPFRRLWTQIRLSWEIIRNKEIDNLFVPSHVLPLIHPKKSTITIHDVAWKHVPESYGFLSKKYLEWGTKYAVKHAKNIIVPSEVTKKDLVHFYCRDAKFRIYANKIHVIPLGFQEPGIKVSEQEENAILKSYNLQPKTFFLYIGRVEHKKNTDTLINAFKIFTKENPDIKLVLAGSLGRGGKEILDLITTDIKDRIIICGYINEEEKHVLMKNAQCFIFPSLYEGFGIPLLEAMHYNLPIIASDIPTSKEVAGNKVQFFNPSDIEELAKLMLNNNKETHYSNILESHTWEKSAKQTLKIINNLQIHSKML